jgi:excinuclease ABC subunit C
MNSAAAEKQFERAAKLRDLWHEISWLDEQVARMAMIRREYSFIYPTRDHAGRAMWFFMRGAQVAAVTRAPRDRATAQRCERILAGVYDDRNAPADLPEKLDQTLIVAAWFRRRPDDLQSVLTPQAARKIINEAAV